MEDGGKDMPDTKWLSCNNDFWTESGGYLNVFALLPALIHSTCVNNTNCVGFMLRDDQGEGVLLKHEPNSGSNGVFKAPSSNRPGN
jgi:hypothetical protein